MFEIMGRIPFLYLTTCILRHGYLQMNAIYEIAVIKLGTCNLIRYLDSTNKNRILIYIFWEMHLISSVLILH